MSDVPPAEPAGSSALSQAQLRGLLDAVVAIASDLSLDRVLEKIIESASGLVGARYVALGVIEQGPTRQLERFITYGISDEERDAIGDLPRGHGILGYIIEHPEPLRLPDLAAHPASYGFPENHPPMVSFLGTPIRIRDQVFGNLYLCEKVDGGDFTAEDEEIVVALAAAAGVVIENARLFEQAARAREDLALLAVYADRDRIGRDLHDLVIQRLFAIGLSLDNVSRLAERPEVRTRLSSAVDEIDATIKEIRRTIVALSAPDDTNGLLKQVHAVLAGSTTVLGFEPTLETSGPVNSLVTDEARMNVLAVLSEAISNAARHARCSALHVVLTAGPTIDLIVQDDGEGFDPQAVERRSGLRNLRERAESMGGSMRIESSSGQGTTLSWSVPR
jgi:signal transduction histidine kinase